MIHICLDSSNSTTRITSTVHLRNSDGLQFERTSPMFSHFGEAIRDEGGLRIEGYFKYSYKRSGIQWMVCDASVKPSEPFDLNFEFGNDKLPLITIVTVVFNGETFLEDTIKSVLNQTYPNVEYIIIDGGSTDGTLDIIRKYEHAIDYWVSEKDSGIYDAMNKGIKLATGGWINFMNAGDHFFSTDTVSLLFKNNSYTEDIIYGSVLVRYMGFSRIQRSGKIENLWKGMQFCHQSAFVKTNFHKLHIFNTSNRIAADMEFFYSAYKRGASFKQVNEVASSYLADGLSDKNRVSTFLAWSNVVSNYNGSAWTKVIYYIYILDFYMRSMLKIIIPKKLVRIIIRMKK